MSNPSEHTRWYGKDPTGRRSTGRNGAAILASAALAVTAVSALPASASITGEVATGHNITVFHNIDFIAATGWTVGESLTVTVLRNGVEIGTATGNAADPEETGAGGLEVNHGPEGAAVAGDCWVGSTPDIRPGDVVQVTNGTLTDEVTVDDITFTGQPSEAPNGDILVPFDAFLFDGTPIPAALLDSAEFRAASNGQVRFEGADVLVQRRAGGAPGEYHMRYQSPFTPTRNDDNAPFGQAQLRRALLGDGHAIGFGHVDPLPLESMLVDGLTDVPGPAPGCEAAPSAQWGVTNVTPANLNLANRAGGLTVTGMATGATAVTVNLTDAAGTVVSKEASGTEAWTASFTSEELAPLDGDITVDGQYSLAGGDVSGATKTVVKDLVRPNAPTASLPSGTYRGAKSIRLRAAAGEQIRYTLGNGRQARPTADSGNLYDGQRIRITANQALKMVAVDEAGNASPMVRVNYRIGNVPSRPRIRRAFSGRPGGRDTAVARWRAPRFNNGSRVTGYRVMALRLRRNGSVASQRQSRVLQSSTRSFSMRLRSGNYRFRVRAINGLGQSKLSPRSNRVQSR